MYERAKSVALMSDLRTKVGCVAVYKKNVIATGFNCNKTHPVQKEYNKYRHFADTPRTLHTLHAEIHCLIPISSFDIDWSNVTLYIVRVLKDNTLAMARPCPACMHYIKDLGIKNIYYTTNDGFAYENLQKEII